MSNKDNKIYSWFSIICFIFPRISISYILYILPSLFSVKLSQRQSSFAFLFLTALIIACISSGFFGDVSITAFLISVFLQIPFFFFLFRLHFKEGLDGLKLLRGINIATIILSVANMVTLGFPLRLPYVDFLPDAYSALYGQGGAKIVTIIGFFGLAAELFTEEPKINKPLLFISLLNFLVPSYLIGIVMGLGALGIVALRKKPLLIPLILIIVLIVAPYFLARMEKLNTGFSEQTGEHPKIYSYILVYKLYEAYPSSILLGTGLGQFTSTPALWASKYISSLSTHDIPDLPGLNMSKYHQSMLGPVLKNIIDDRWSLSSSASKPYSSISTILSEYGLAMSLVIFSLLYRAFAGMGITKKYTLSIMFFTLFIFLVDLWHDNLWYGYLLLLSASISNKSV